MLRRFWFEFVFADRWKAPAGTMMGCGVTVGSKEEAIKLLMERVFDEGPFPFPEIKRCVEDVDLATLDQNHVVPNMGDPLLPGVWFPLGYNHDF